MTIASRDDFKNITNIGNLRLIFTVRHPIFMESRDYYSDGSWIIVRKDTKSVVVGSTHNDLSTAKMAWIECLTLQGFIVEY